MSGPAGWCPPASPEPAPSDQGVRHAVAIDYVDFLQWGGRNYTAATSFGVARLGTVPAATRADLGPTVFTVRCRLGQWNEITHAEPSVTDGDAAFLPSETPVRAMRGWPIECRLVAETTDGLAVYLADSTDRGTHQPDPCATAPSTLTPAPTG